jgi:hypothetical protein
MAQVYDTASLDTLSVVAGYLEVGDISSLVLTGSVSAGIPLCREKERVLKDIKNSSKLYKTQKGFMKAHVDELVGALTLGGYTKKYNDLASMASPLQVVGLIYPQIVGISEHGLSRAQVRVPNYDHHTNTAIRDGLDYEVVAGLNSQQIVGIREHNLSREQVSVPNFGYHTNAAISGGLAYQDVAGLDYQQIVGIREHNLSREQVSVPNYGYHTNAAIRNGLAYQDVARLDHQQLQALRAELDLGQSELQAFRAQQQMSTYDQGRAGDSCCVIC